MNEAETIDPTLKAAGRGVVEGHGKRGKALAADYVLVYRKLAVDETKAWDKPLTEAVGQVKNYADKLRHACCTNGQASPASPSGSSPHWRR